MLKGRACSTESDDREKALQDLLSSYRSVTEKFDFREICAVGRSEADISINGSVKKTRCLVLHGQMLTF